MNVELPKLKIWIYLKKLKKSKYLYYLDFYIYKLLEDKISHDKLKRKLSTSWDWIYFKIFKNENFIILIIFRRQDFGLKISKEIYKLNNSNFWEYQL